MSILTRKTPSATPPEAEKQSIWKAPQVAAKLAAAEAVLAQLEQRYSAMVADAVLADTPDDLIELERQIVQARANVERLKKAHAGALRDDTLLRERHLTEGRKSQLRVVQAQLRIADKATEAFSKSLAEAIKHFADIIEHRKKAGDAATSPIFGHVDAPKVLSGAYCERHKIKELAEKEIARLAGVINIGGDCAFPGGQTHDLHFRLQPQLLPAMQDTLHKASNYVITALQGKIGVAEGED